MDKYIVKLLSQAYRDIEKIYNYISQNFQENEIALNLVDDIEDAIFSLEDLPYRGAERKIGLYANKGYRQLFFKNFTIVYRVDADKKYVIIITVRYSRGNF